MRIQNKTKIHPKRYDFLFVIFSIVFAITACGGSSSESTSTASDSALAELTSEEDVIDEPSMSTRSMYIPNSVISIGQGQGGFAHELDSGDRFARDHDNAGDINGDGIADMVVGARSDDDGMTDAGAVYILFMDAQGGVLGEQKISMLEGNFPDTLNEGSFFGYGVAGIGDYDGDNIPDIAVSAPGSIVPSIYIFHLNTNGTIKSTVVNRNFVALGLSAIGDINQDGRIDLVAAQPDNREGGLIKLLFFNQDSLIDTSNIVTIGENSGGFGNGIEENDSFGGRESALLGDLDLDGNPELAIGAFESDGGSGAIWILSIDKESFNVIDKLKIGPGLAGFNETIPLTSNPNGTVGGHFGHALIAAGDLNNDGIPDLISGANQYGNGVAYVIYLNQDKSVKTFTRINESEGGLDLNLLSEERFSRSMSITSEKDEQGFLYINIGGGATGEGKIYRLKLENCSLEQQTENSFWDEGNTLFTNWDPVLQSVSAPLSFEQCTLKATENKAVKFTFNQNDGRCIVKDNSAVLSSDSEDGQAYVKFCPVPFG